MNSNLGSQQNNILKNGQNTKDDSDITNINQSDLLIFLQFYFINAYKNLSQILSDKVITNESEISKITSSFNFWLNFSLNFKDSSFVNLLLFKKDDRATFCINKLKEIIKLIVKFLYNNLKSEEAYNRILKDNHTKVYELLLKLKDIIDNVYNSDLKEEIFINLNEENPNNKEGPSDNEKDSEKNENKNNNEEQNGKLIIPKMVENINEPNQFSNNNVDREKINNIIKNNIIINNNLENVSLNNNCNNSNNGFNDINQNKILFFPNFENNENNENNGNNENINQNKKENNENINNINNNNINNSNNMFTIMDENNNIIYQDIINDNNISPNNINNINNNNNNYFPLKVNFPSLNYDEICKLFYNFCYFTNFNLRFFQIVFFEKIGYAFLNYNGDFMWADEFTSHVLFEEDNIKKLNLFNIMTDFSKYILKKKYKDHFFDFKDESNRLRVFTYTIDSAKINEQENKKKGEKLFEDLSKIKTLVSRASPILLKGKGENYIACIFLETKFSFYRQNFDFFYWKSDWNNK